MSNHFVLWLQGSIGEWYSAMFLCQVNGDMSHWKPAGLSSAQSLPATDSASAEQLSSSTQAAYYVPMEITNRVFNDSLLDPSSSYFQTLYEEVTTLVRWTTTNDDDHFSEKDFMFLWGQGFYIL